MIEATSFGKLQSKIYGILALANPNRDAVVFDIDDTVLTYDPRSWCKSKRIKAIATLYDYCLTHGIPVIFITARMWSQESQRYTQQQLACLNMGVYTKLYMRPPQVGTWAGISRFKANARRDAAQDYNILLNMGDQWSDLFETSNESILDTLDQQYRNKYILYKPRSTETATWALKLPALQ
ncbi:MAG: HAD family acid phosphatase [Gammaproteobacteria bacterium]|nr:HAD family acid phosphatase [Gammaproteobacteria bacterium]